MQKAGGGGKGTIDEEDEEGDEFVVYPLSQ
jgi:hypothetical protein